jgi:hypothetical protein
MMCKQYQQLLHLNRPGEISEHEAEDLRQHLLLCEECSLEYQRIRRADEFIDRLTSLSPTPSDAGELTAAILHRVRSEAAPRRPLTPIDRIAEIFLQPLVRYAAVAVVLMITTTLAVQLLTTLNDIYALEQRMAKPRSNPAGSTPTYSVESKTLQEIAKAAKGIAGNVSYSVVDGRLEVPEIDVESLLSSYYVKNLSSIIGSTSLHIDKKTLERIVNEVKATAKRSFSVGGEGA